MSIIFDGNYMKQDRLVNAHKSVINMYIVYKSNAKKDSLSTAENCLFGAVKSTKGINNSHYKYSGYGLCFDRDSDFTIGNITNRKNVMILGADMSFITDSNYTKSNSIYVLGRGEIQGFSTDGGSHTIKAQKLYKTNFTQPNKKFVLKFKAKIDGTDTIPLALGNISIDCPITNSTKTSLYGNAYDFAVDYEPISGVKTIYNIRRYLMTKRNI